MKKILFSIFSVFLAALFQESMANNQEARLLRFPDIHNGQIVFTYAGDLYLSSTNSGSARKLTSHPGYEMFARFSPDGKHIAFTGQYDGNTEVFVIPSEGGEPKRLTYTATLSRDDVGDRMGPNNIVLDWTPDGKKIMYRTRAYTFNDFTGQLMTISLDGGIPEPFPLKNGGFASFSPDGKKIAYNYIFREFRSWKRYTGGMADDIRVMDIKSGKSERISGNVNQDVFPMWSKDGENIYYISDRDGFMNLYCWNMQSKETDQLTFYTDYDIKFPSYGDGVIVYEHGGYIVQYDPVNKVEKRASVMINNDAAYARGEWKELASRIRSFSLSPKGERILAVARGDLFSVPTKNGITYNLTNSCDAHDKNADWAPDGSGYAYVSDKDGEFNIYFNDNKGSDVKLTDVKGYIYGFEWSPDSRKILWSDKNNTLNLINLETKENQVLENSGIGPLNDYNWAPDSRHIVYTKPGKYVNVVVVLDTQENKKYDITDQWYNSGSGNFSSDGKYLLFASDRTFNPMYGRTEWNHIYNSMGKIYILPLTSHAKVPFAPENDTVSVTTKGVETDQKSKESVKSTEKQEYDFSNVSSKIVEVPVSPSSYGNIHMIDNRIYYGTRRGTYMYDLEDKKQTFLQANIIFAHGYKKALAVSGRDVQVVDIPRAPVTVKNAVSLEGVKKYVDYKEEWMQIYNETWRQMRDFFYAKNMHGVDWDKVGEKYRELVPYVGHRSDLTYLLGELIGELNVGHAYSQNGEKPEPQRIKMGLLGISYSKDKSGFFKVEEVLKGANWSESLRSPLTMPGCEVEVNEFIVSVNGVSTNGANDLAELLVGTAGMVTELEVNSKASRQGARKILTIPLEDESKLRYYNWVQGNIKKVSDATNGQVGYIHIPDMGSDGLNEFVKHYYPQLGKKALIIDDRGNGGGNVSPMIIERLQRTITYFTMHTNQTEGSLNPVGTFDGPKVLLVNEYSASDGDLFPYRFKYNKLGTVIGKRTWGGVVGYSGTVPVVDGGSIVTPSYAPFASDGSGWIIEGEGVYPDIEIENDPYAEFNGYDAQLEKAIEVAKKEIEKYEYRPAVIPTFPDKSAQKK